MDTLIEDCPVLAVEVLKNELWLADKLGKSQPRDLLDSHRPILVLLGALDKPAPELRAAARKEMGNDAAPGRLDQFMREAQTVKTAWNNILHPEQSSSNIAAFGSNRGKAYNPSGHRPG